MATITPTYMQPITALDIKSRFGIRLQQGDFYRTTTKHDPVYVLRTLKTSNITKVHCVDLDGSLGYGNNAFINAIFSSHTNMPLRQIGGGLRSIVLGNRCLTNSTTNLVVGTSVVQKLTSVFELCLCCPNSVSISVDVRNQLVACDGWTAQTKISFATAVERTKDLGVGELITTNIAADGLLSGLTKNQLLLRDARLSLIVSLSGSMLGAEDVVAMLMYQSFVHHVVCGSAVWHGLVQLNVVNMFLRHHYQKYVQV